MRTRHVNHRCVLCSTAMCAVDSVWTRSIPWFFYIHINFPIGVANRSRRFKTTLADHGRHWRTQLSVRRPQLSSSTQHHRCITRDQYGTLADHRRCVRRAGRQASTSGTRCLAHRPSSRQHGLAMRPEILSKLFRN